MSAGQIVGMAICTLAAVGLVGSTIVTMGWRDALALWGFSITFSAALCLGILLLFGEVTL